MRTISWLLGILVVVAMCAGGCSKEEPVAEEVLADNLTQGLASADASVKDQAEMAAFSLQAEDYEQALSDLTKLASNPKLTADQKKLVNDTIAKVKQLLKQQAKAAAEEVKAGAEKATQEVNKAVEQGAKALEQGAAKAGKALEGATKALTPEKK